MIKAAQGLLLEASRRGTNKDREAAFEREVRRKATETEGLVQ